MNRIGEAFEELFTRENWKYRQKDDRSFFFSFRGNNHRFDFWAIINEKGNVLAVYVILPFTATRDKRSLVAEFLHRANYDMMIGNFEIDYNDGEIRFKTSVDFMEYPVEPEVINRMIDTSLAMADIYTPGLGVLIYADFTPEQAIDKVEKQTPESRSTLIQ